MKRWYMAASMALLMLTGCAQIQKEQAVDAEKAAKEQSMHDEATCLSYGYTLGSKAYGHCRERLHALNVQDAEAKQALAIAHQQQVQNALNAAAAEGAIMQYESRPYYIH